MSGKRLLTTLAVAKKPFVTKYTNIRAIHVFPTIDVNLWSLEDETKVDRHRRLLVTDYSSSFLTLKRHKSARKKQHQAKNNESDSEDDEEEELDAEPGDKAKVMKMTLRSMRIDLVVKSCMAMSRANAEAALYESKIRINGEKVLKKSVQAQVGDVIDLVRGRSPRNPDFIVVTRVTVLAAINETIHWKIKFTKDKTLTIENYEDGWTSVDS